MADSDGRPLENEISPRAPFGPSSLSMQSSRTVTMSEQMKTANKSRPTGKLSICRGLELSDTDRDDLSLCYNSSNSLNLIQQPNYPGHSRADQITGTMTVLCEMFVRTENEPACQNVSDLATCFLIYIFFLSVFFLPTVSFNLSSRRN